MTLPVSLESAAQVVMLAKANNMQNSRFNVVCLSVIFSYIGEVGKIGKS